jgi:hypothetical protein
MELLIRIYKHKNMQLDKFSDEKDGDSLMRESEYSVNTLQQIFFDYLEKVREGSLFIVDAKYNKKEDCDTKTTRLFVNESIHKLISSLVTRNCLIRKKNMYRKTDVFKKWLEETLRKDEDDLSDVLEARINESNLAELKSSEAFKSVSKAAK